MEMKRVRACLLVTGNVGTDGIQLPVENVQLFSNVVIFVFSSPVHQLWRLDCHHPSLARVSLRITRVLLDLDDDVAGKSHYPRLVTENAGWQHVTQHAPDVQCQP